MCGIFGLVHADPSARVAQSIVDGLTMLQHRGQDAAGILVLSQSGRVNVRKDTGTVADVFKERDMVSLCGRIGIGHVRYPTAGGQSPLDAQPFFTNYPHGIAISHNGNLTNTKELATELLLHNRHVNTDSDSEVLLNTFAHELQLHTADHTITASDIFNAVRVLMHKVRGSYAAVLLINHIGMLAFRDLYGIRPLCFGQRPSRTIHGQFDLAIASESVAIDSLDPLFSVTRDISPGEALFFSLSGELSTQRLHHISTSPCLFEYVYFARPDSLMDGIRVNNARANMGEALAEKIVSLLCPSSDHTHTDSPLHLTPTQHARLTSLIDVVMPIPETSRTAALQCARWLQLPYREGFVKNRYIARTFIMPETCNRQRRVRLKLNTVRSEFTGLKVLLVDESIVRGTTSRELVQMARDAGAAAVYFASAAPKVIAANVYGIDIPSRRNLVAVEVLDGEECRVRSDEELAMLLNADLVIFNDLLTVQRCVTSLSPADRPIAACEDSCFSGHYVTGDVDEEFFRAQDR